MRVGVLNADTQVGDGSGAGAAWAKSLLFRADMQKVGIMYPLRVSGPGGCVGKGSGPGFFLTTPGLTGQNSEREEELAVKLIDPRAARKRGSVGWRR